MADGNLVGQGGWLADPDTANGPVIAAALAHGVNGEDVGALHRLPVPADAFLLVDWEIAISVHRTAVVTNPQHLFIGFGDFNGAFITIDMFIGPDDCDCILSDDLGGGFGIVATTGPVFNWRIRRVSCTLYIFRDSTLLASGGLLAFGGLLTAEPFLYYVDPNDVPGDSLAYVTFRTL